MSLGFEFPERAAIMDTFVPSVSAAEPVTPVHKEALLSLSGWLRRPA